MKPPDPKSHRSIILYPNWDLGGGFDVDRPPLWDEQIGQKSEILEISQIDLESSKKCQGIVRKLFWESGIDLG